VDETYRLPLKEIAISTWLRDVVRERFDSDADVRGTPVDRALFHPCRDVSGLTGAASAELHHEYAGKASPTAFIAVAAGEGPVPERSARGIRVKPPRTPAAYDQFHVNPPQTKLRRSIAAARSPVPVV